MDYDESENNEEISQDTTCPRCGLRVLDEICPSCGTPIISKTDEEEEEYDWRESRGGRRRF